VTYSSAIPGKGVNAVSAAYQGDPAHLTSSGSTTVPVTMRTTTTTLSCTPGSVALGAPSTCTATVSDSSDPASATSPTGAVTFSSKKNDQLDPTSCTLSAATADSSSCQTTETPESGTGSHVLKARYGGDHTQHPSTGTTSLKVT
jgi:hypothetical protein